MLSLYEIFHTRYHLGWVFRSNFCLACAGLIESMALPHKSITSHSVFPLTLLYDGDCEVCATEMSDLQARDRDQRLIFVDITQPRFDPQRYGTGLSELRAKIHAVRPDGRILKGVSVLHVAYAAVGRGWIFAPVKWPFLRPALDATYSLLSKHRSLISRVASPWLFKVWDRRARGTLERMQARCVSEDPVSVFLPLALAQAAARSQRPPQPEPRASSKDLAALRLDLDVENVSSSVWQDTLPAVSPPTRKS